MIQINEEEDYKVQLEGIFEGPMDLLVYLIRKNELDVADIPIAFITDQYLGYLEWMKGMNIDFAGEFLIMASTLMQIKSKMLLPVHGDEEEEEDPRIQIARPLQEYLEMKIAAEKLGERPMLGDGTFVRQTDRKEYLADFDDDVIQVGLFELIDAFQKILKSVSPEHKFQLTADGISVKDRISQLVDILEEKGSIAFDELFTSPVTKSDIVVTFLAILEMTKICLIRVVQHVETGIIRIFYL